MTASVDIWVVALRTRRIPAFKAVLSPEEQRRASRFHRRLDAVRFAASHGALRTVLASVLGGTPAAIRFGVNAVGRPEVIWPERPPTHFSLSHSGDLTAIALSVDGPVGIDIESGPRFVSDVRKWVQHEALLKLRGAPGAPDAPGAGSQELPLGSYWFGSLAVIDGPASVVMRAAEILGDGRLAVREFTVDWLERVCPGPDAVLDVRDWASMG